MAKRLNTPPSPGQPRAFGYVRVSTDQQADSGLSTAEQQVKIRARCTENNWQLAEIFIDDGVSGSTPLGKRPQGAMLLAAVRPGDVVVAARMDRMFRSAFNALETIQDFKKRRIGLWLLDLGGDVTGNGISQLVATILGAVAEFERTLISERTRDVKRNLRRNGKHQGGSRPFGWQLGPIVINGDGRAQARDLVPDPDEQREIATMRRLRAGGSSLIAIRDAVRAKGFEVSHVTVRAILARCEDEDAAALG